MNRQKEILGAMILDPALADHPDLKPSLFSSGFERSTLEAIQELRQNGSTVDIAELARCEKLCEIEGVASQLAGLLDGQQKLSPKTFEKKLSIMIRNQIILPLVNESKKAEREILKKVDPNLDRFEKKIRKAVADLDKLIPEKKEVQFESLSWLLAREIAPRETLIDPILGQQEKTMIHAAPKFGKTALALQLAKCGTEGRDWLGFKVKKKFTSLIIQAELSETLFRDRVAKVFDKSGAQDQIFIPARSRRLYVDTKSGRSEIASLIERVQPDNVVIDPYIRFWEDEERALKNPTIFFDFFDDMISEFGITLFLVHHDTKEQENRIGGRRAMGNIDRFTDGNWNLERIAGLPEADFFRTVRLSFESRNWERIRPLDLRMNDKMLFEITELPKSSADPWSIVEELEKAGGSMPLKDLRKKFSSMDMFYKAKKKAFDEDLIDEVRLEGSPGNPVIISIK